VHASGLVAHHHLTAAVLLLLDVDFHLITDREIGLVAEFADGHHTFGLVADVDHHLLLVHAHHGTHEHFLLGDAAEGVLVGLLHLRALFAAVDGLLVVLDTAPNRNRLVVRRR
jgi:hypothetical protein